MRVSLDENGPVPGIEIRLNGQLMRNVIMADEEAGVVVCLKREGFLFVLNEERTEVLREELRGEVRITMPKAVSVRWPLRRMRRAAA